MKLNLKNASLGAASALATIVFADVPARAAVSNASLMPENTVLIGQSAGPSNAMNATLGNPALVTSLRGTELVMAQSAQTRFSDNPLPLVTLIAVLLLSMGGIIALRRKQLDRDTLQSISTDF